MRVLFVGLLIGVTSSGAYLVGVARLGRRPGGLLGAVARLLETAGLVLVFAAAHVIAGLALVAIFRVLTGQFVSVYVVVDNIWWVLWVVQALLFQWWRSA